MDLLHPRGRFVRRRSRGSSAAPPTAPPSRPVRAIVFDPGRAAATSAAHHVRATRRWSKSRTPRRPAARALRPAARTPARTRSRSRRSSAMLVSVVNATAGERPAARAGTGPPARPPCAARRPRCPRCRTPAACRRRRAPSRIARAAATTCTCRRSAHRWCSGDRRVQQCRAPARQHPRLLHRCRISVVRERSRDASMFATNSSSDTCSGS